MAFVGDSLINTYMDTATTKPETIKNNLEEYIRSAYAVDLAQGGLALFSSDGSGAFVNSTTLEVSSTYTGYVSNVHNPNNVHLAIISLGTNGHAAIAADPDLANDCWDVLIAQLQSDFPRLTKIINFVMGRQLGATGQDWQTPRDLNKALYLRHPIVDEDGIEIYYLDYNAGDVHPDSNGETDFIPHLTNRILAELGYISSVGTIGMKITNVEKTDTTKVTITISHDGGSSLVVPTDGEDYYYIVVSGTPYQATAATVLNSTQIELTFGVTISGSFDFYYLYDEAFGTAATNTPYTQDNNGLWLRSYSETGLT